MVQRGFLKFGANHLIYPIASLEAAPRNSALADRNRRKAKRSGADLIEDNVSDSSEVDHSDFSVDERLPRAKKRRRIESDELIRGTFRAAQGGFGFVRPLDPGILDSLDDIFIPARFVKSAMEGDLVDVQLLSSRSGQGREGAIVEIVQRGRRKFVGTFQIVNDERSCGWTEYQLSIP